MVLSIFLDFLGFLEFYYYIILYHTSYKDSSYFGMRFTIISARLTPLISHAMWARPLYISHIWFDGSLCDPRCLLYVWCSWNRAPRSVYISLIAYWYVWCFWDKFPRSFYISILSRCNSLRHSLSRSSSCNLTSCSAYLDCSRKSLQVRYDSKPIS